MVFAFAIVEKKNHNAVHGLFNSLSSAQSHLQDVIPIYVRKGYFDDKSLKPNDFKIRKRSLQAKKCQKGGRKSKSPRTRQTRK